MLIQESGDLRAKKLLYNRLSFEIQEGNAASIFGTSRNNEKFDEIYL